nr:unnamed protein product [Callosobruchus analis]
METQDIDPFKRRESLKRTPPGRSRSSPGKDGSGHNPKGAEEKEENRFKRKRAETVSCSPTADTDELDLTIQALVSKARILEGYISQISNTKKEIKDAGSDIMRMSLKLQRLNSDRKRTGNAVTTASATQTLCTMVDKGTQGTAEACTQTTMSPEELERQIAEIRTRIEEGSSFEEFVEIADRDWPEEVYTKVKAVTGDVMSAAKDQDLAIITTPDLEMARGIARRFRERFGWAEALRAQDQQLGGVTYLVNTISVPTQHGLEKNERYVWYILAESEPLELADRETVYKAIGKLKARMEEGNRHKIALPYIATHRNDELLKALEFVFSKSEVEIYIYNTERSQEERKKEQNKNNPTAVGKKRKSNVREGVIVKSDGRSYAELVKSLKAGVNLKNVEVEVSKMRKTQNGDVLLELNKGKAEDLQTAISTQLHNLNVVKKNKRTVLHVRGMDNETTENDIIAAVKEHCGETEIDCRITSLRPAAGETKNATLVVNETASRKLIRAGKVRIGLVHCPIRERNEDGRCRKCWTYGHSQAKCSGPDRANLCLRCGKPGHRIKDCCNAAFCPICNIEGHQAGKDCGGGPQKSQ